jgi:type I restriction enzyme, S subunit
MNGYPTSPLQRILSRSQDAVQINPDEVYKQVTVRLFHKGVVLRGEQPGGTIRSTRQFRVRAGQVLLSRIDARNGAIGLVPSELEDAVVTNDFWAFNVDRHLADPRFIDLYFGTGQFVEACQRASEGTTNRVRLQSERFLQIEVPLPPLPEQRRIVARVDQLSTKIEEARRLRLQAKAESAVISRSNAEAMYQKLAKVHGLCRLGEVCTSITDGDHNTPAFADHGVRFIFVGNVSSGHLHFHGCKCVRESYFSALKPQRVPERGDILFSAVGATLGVPALVDTDEPFCFQRHIAILKPERRHLDSQFALHMLRSNTVFRAAWGSTTGSAQPTVPLRAINQLPIPIPPLAEQRRAAAQLDTLQVQVGELTCSQDEGARELDALMPSILSQAFAGEL